MHNLEEADCIRILNPTAVDREAMPVTPDLVAPEETR
jgi:hypothetical protein